MVPLIGSVEEFINQKNIKKAIRVLHKEFDLD